MDRKKQKKVRRRRLQKKQERTQVERAIQSRIEELRTEKRAWRKWVAGTSVLVAVVFLMSHVFFGMAVVEGNSMNPSFVDGELTVYMRIPGEIRRGDVVLVGISDDRTLIKRVIALPGEELYIGDDGVYIDGIRLEETHAAGITEPEAGQENPCVLGEGEYFVMGDNREDSLDSRHYGSIRREQIKGKVITLTKQKGL